MRILMLTQYFPPETGAAQVRLFEVAKAIKSQGHQIEVVTAFPNYPTGVIPPEYRGKFFMKDTVDGIPLYRTWIYPVQRGRFWKRLLNYFSFVLSACYGVGKAGPADYIFVESPPIFLGFTMFFARRLKKARVILNISDLWPESAISLGLVKNKLLIELTTLLENRMYKVAWRISAQTEGIIETLRQRGISPTKMVFLPNGVDPELFTPCSPDQELVESLKLQNKIVILYAGTIGYAAGLEVALQAAEKLRAKSELVFLIVGDGTEKPRLQKLAAEMQLPNVRWLPFQPLHEIVRYYNLAALSLVTLRRYKLAEGVRPSKLFPGLASAKPVVYVGEGEGARIMAESGGGVIIPPEDSGRLAETILELIANPEQCREMGRKGRNYVIENYTWRVLVAKWLQDLKI
jgi:glycosyltransferase involved in cell wall biosynthesis